MDVARDPSPLLLLSMNEPAEQRLPVLVDLFERLDGLPQRLLGATALRDIDGNHDGPRRVSGGVTKGREAERKRSLALDQLDPSVASRERSADPVDHPLVFDEEIGCRPAQRLARLLTERIRTDPGGKGDHAVAVGRE